MQLIVALNLTVVAVGLPYFWNREVDRRAAARAKQRAAAAAALPTSDAAAERLAIQVRVHSTTCRGVSYGAACLAPHRTHPPPAPACSCW